MRQTANQYKDRYLRFKADEAAQALTGAYRQTHPEDNNERQAIHEHVSVALGPTPAEEHAATGTAATCEAEEAISRCGTISASRSSQTKGHIG